MPGFVCDVAIVRTFMLQLLEFSGFFKCTGMELLANIVIFYETIILHPTSHVLRF